MERFWPRNDWRCTTPVSSCAAPRPCPFRQMQIRIHSAPCASSFCTWYSGIQMQRGNANRDTVVCPCIWQPLRRVRVVPTKWKRSIRAVIRINLLEQSGDQLPFRNEQRRMQRLEHAIQCTVRIPTCRLCTRKKSFQEPWARKKMSLLELRRRPQEQRQIPFQSVSGTRPCKSMPNAKKWPFKS